MPRLLPYLLLLTLQVHAQILPVRNFTVGDGLASNSVYALLRDSRGLLWVGTPNGVSWYDGSGFISPPMEAKGGQVYVNRFFEDSGHNIWVLSFYSGLYKYDIASNRFQNYLVNRSRLTDNANNILDMLELSPGHYLVATDNNVYLFNENGFALLDTGNTHLRGQISCLARMPNGNTWLGTSNGIWNYRQEGGHWKLINHFGEGLIINRIICQSSLTRIACNSGVYAIDPDLPEKTLSPVCLKGILTNSITEDASGTYWASTDQGSFEIRQNQVHHIGTENGLPHNDVRCIYRDKENITWIGTIDGLCRINDDYYTYYPLPSKSSPLVAAGARQGQDLWFAYPGGMIRMTGDRRQYISELNGRAMGFSFFLKPVKDGTVWAGTDLGLATILAGSVRLISPIVATAMYQEPNGRIWLGGQNGKIYYYERGQFHALHFNLPVKENIQAIYRDDRGFLWVGLYSLGVRKFRLIKDSAVLVSAYDSRNGYANLRIRSVVYDGAGHLLFGTRTNGLYVFPLSDSGRIININSKSGLPAPWVKSIAPDGHGKLLLATNAGLFSLVIGYYTKPAIRPIRFSNEKLPNEMNVLVPDGDSIWIGTLGIIKYVPALQEKDTLAPSTFITQVSIEGKVDSVFSGYPFHRPAIHLKYDQNGIAFDFVAMSFKDEKAVRYRYKLDGQDLSWSSPTARRYVNYGHLRPGDYQFEVMARNPDGVWSRSPAVLAFTIAPPYWQTWWFLTLLFLSLAALAYAWYRYRLQRALELAQLRMKISTDLHDDIGSTLSSISILSNIALQQDSGNATSEMLKEIRQHSLLLMERMDDIVWSINPGNDSLADLLLRVKHFAATLFEARGMDYDFYLDERIGHLKLPMDFRQNLYLLMKEAINNMVKYAEASSARIRVEYEAPHLHVIISDNGKGIDPQLENRGNGLSSMKRRADLMKGSLSIYSRKGTKIHLKVKFK